jgi:tRNA (mo5U34)-methyltransferase
VNVASAEPISAMRWYHTLDLPNGVTTPGEYDLRGIVDALPWPADMAGMRCLDVGSRDGFYAFEMERRGAAEVVSLDIDDPSALHFPATFAPGIELIQKELDAGHRAFAAAASALSSEVQRLNHSVYDLHSTDLGTFDFAVLGTLLLHLRDPVKALTEIAGTLDGQFLLNEPVIPGRASFRSHPRAELMMRDGPFWWLCNPAGHKRLIEAAGMRPLRGSRPYVIPWGSGFAPPSLGKTLAGHPFGLPRRLLERRGALHAWTLAATR